MAKAKLPPTSSELRDDLESLERIVEGLVKAHRGLTQRIESVEHRISHLVERVTAVDGQAGGGDEQTSLEFAEDAASNPAGGGDYYRQSPVDPPDEP